MSTYDPSGPGQGDGSRPPHDGQPPYDGVPPGEPPAYGGPYGTPPPAYGTSRQGPGGGGPVSGMPALGGWGARIVARLIDLLLVSAVIVVIVLPITGLHNTGSSLSLSLSLGFAVLYLFYEGLMLSRDGQTLGKKAMRIRVAMLADGAKPDPAAAWTRAIVYIIPAVFCCGGVWWLIDGLVGVFNQPYRQCIHDRAARTVVVSTV